MQKQKGRTPQGVRGLKLRSEDPEKKNQKSHSARSAWIEMRLTDGLLMRKRVALRKECVD